MYIKTNKTEEYNNLVYLIEYYDNKLYPIDVEFFRNNDDMVIKVKDMLNLNKKMCLVT